MSEGLIATRHNQHHSSARCHCQSLSGHYKRGFVSGRVELSLVALLYYHYILDQANNLTA